MCRVEQVPPPRSAKQVRKCVVLGSCGVFVLFMKIINYFTYDPTNKFHTSTILLFYSILLAIDEDRYLASEVCSGGELFMYVADRGRLSEAHGRVIMRQLVTAVNYLHDRGIL